MMSLKNVIKISSFKFDQIFLIDVNKVLLLNKVSRNNGKDWRYIAGYLKGTNFRGYLFSRAKKKNLYFARINFRE